jgi:hypothetical protein
LDGPVVLKFYSFDGFNKYYVVPILCIFMVVANLLVYLGLLPSRSRLRFEGPTSPGDSPKKRVVVIEDPVLIPSPTTLTVCT